MIILFMGPPGAGKGTQAKELARRCSIPQISTGDILRAAIGNGTELGNKAKSFIDAGELVPDEVVIGIIDERISEPDTGKGFILDGFPRTVNQANELKEMLKKRGLSIQSALNIDVPDEEITSRLLKRAEIENRSDDTAEVINKRLENYKSQTQPLIDYYQKEGLLIEINGVGLPSEIEERITRAIGA